MYVVAETWAASLFLLDQQSINRVDWGQRDRSFTDWLAGLVNRFHQTNADRDATNYNGVGVIDRIAGQTGDYAITGSLLGIYRVSNVLHKQRNRGKFDKFRANIGLLGFPKPRPILLRENRMG